MDPVQQYTLAAGIYQHVQLLNSYLEAEVARDDVVPLLFTVQGVDAQAAGDVVTGQGGDLLQGTLHTIENAG